MTQEPEEKDRRFIIHYFVGDGSVKIIEEAIPLLNIPRQVFLSRRQLCKVGMDNPPVYFTEQDLTIGSVHQICGRLFEVYNCDEHVVNFAVQNPDMYPPAEVDRFRQAIEKHSRTVTLLEQADHLEPTDTLEEKVKAALVKLKRWQKVSHQRLYQLFLELDTGKTDVIDLTVLRGMSSQLGVSVEEDVLKGVFRALGSAGDCVMQFTRFLHALNMMWHGMRKLAGEPADLRVNE